MSLHREVRFEEEICAHLAAQAWLHAEAEAAHFDRATGQTDMRGWARRSEGARELLTEEKVYSGGVFDNNSCDLKIFSFPALD